jgi:hypothetical protein
MGYIRLLSETEQVNGGGSYPVFLREGYFVSQLRLSLRLIEGGFHSVAVNNFMIVCVVLVSSINNVPPYCRNN